MDRRYEDVVRMITNAALFKLQLNSHRGTIEDLPFDQIIHCLTEEVHEVVHAYGEKRWDDVIVECADVLNFVIAVALQAQNKYRSRIRERTTGVQVTNGAEMGYNSDDSEAEPIGARVDRLIPRG